MHTLGLESANKTTHEMHPHSLKYPLSSEEEQYRGFGHPVPLQSPQDAVMEDELGRRLITGRTTARSNITYTNPGVTYPTYATLGKKPVEVRLPSLDALVARDRHRSVLLQTTASLVFSSPRHARRALYLTTSLLQTLLDGLLVQKEAHIALIPEFVDEYPQPLRFDRPLPLPPTPLYLDGASLVGLDGHSLVGLDLGMAVPFVRQAPLPPLPLPGQQLRHQQSQALESVASKGLRETKKQDDSGLGLLANYTLTIKFNQQPEEERKYQCKTCGRKFKTSGHVSRHLRIHTGERKHVCPFPGCGARFARHDNCMQHYKTHSNLNGKTVERMRNLKLKEQLLTKKMKIKALIW